MGALLTYLSNRRFNPLSLGGLAIWLDATHAPSLTFNGANVSQWANRGSAGHATQGTALNQPKYVASAINGRPALQGKHDGTNASMLVVADGVALDYTAFELFMVCQRVTDTAAAECVVAKWDSGLSQAEFNAEITSTDFPRLGFSNNGFTINSTTWGSTLATGVPIVCNAGFAPGSPGTAFVRVGNGTAVTSTAVNSVFSGTAPFSVFARNSSGAVLTAQSFSGYVGEVLFFTRALSAGEQRTVTSYLTSKWGILA